MVYSSPETTYNFSYFGDSGDNRAKTPAASYNPYYSSDKEDDHD